MSRQEGFVYDWDNSMGGQRLSCRGTERRWWERWQKQGASSALPLVFKLALTRHSKMNLVKINIVYSFYDFCCCNQTVSVVGSRRYILLHLEHAQIMKAKPPWFSYLGQANYATLPIGRANWSNIPGYVCMLVLRAFNYLRDCHSLMTALPERADAVLQLASIIRPRILR